MQGLETKQLIIPKKLIEKVLENEKFDAITPKDLIGTGLIKGCGKEGEMYFIHLTYQEYSLAKYISSLSGQQQSTFVQTYRYKPQFHLVIRMLAGCLWEESNGDPKTLETFFEWLYTGHVDMIGSYQTELVLACLDECRSEKLEEMIWNKYPIADFVNYVLKHEATRDCLMRFMALSGKAFAQVMKAVQEDDTEEQVSWFFDNLEHCVRGDYLSDRFWAFMSWGIQHPSKYVRESAVKALGKVATHADKETVPIILGLLQTALGDTEWLCANLPQMPLERLQPMQTKKPFPSF